MLYVYVPLLDNYIKLMITGFVAQIIYIINYKSTFNYVYL